MSTWYITPTSEDVMHGSHKYIDKIWKNGKWRYVYYRTKIKAKNVIGVGQKKRLERANENVKTANKSHEVIKNWTSYLRERGDKESLNNVMKENLEEFEKVQKAKRRQKRAQEAYDKTLLGKIDQVKNIGLKAWDKFTGLFDNVKTTVTNKGAIQTRSGLLTKKHRYVVKTGAPGSMIKTQYTPSYSTKKKRK